MLAPLLVGSLLFECAAHGTTAHRLAGRTSPHIPVQLAEGVSDAWRQCLARDARRALAELSSVAADATSSAEADECVDWLTRRMREADRDLVSADYLARNCALALGARRRNAWAQAVPWAVFCESVLPYASFDEPRDDWRPLFAELLAPVVADARSVEEAALLMNVRLWRQWEPPVVFVPMQTRAGHAGQLSPLAVVRARNASCTGLSIMLVAALRAVGVPARVVGTPVWNRPGCGHAPTEPDACGNHNWVEVYSPAAGRWRFVGAAEPADEGFDHAWFWPDPAQLQVAGALNTSIYAARFGPPAPERADGARHHFPMIWAWDDRTVGADDVTEHYRPPPGDR